MTQSFVDRAVAKATAPLLVEVAEAKVLLAKREDEVADLKAYIVRLTAERDTLKWAAEEHVAELDKLDASYGR